LADAFGDQPGLLRPLAIAGLAGQIEIDMRYTAVVQRESLRKKPRALIQGRLVIASRPTQVRNLHGNIRSRRENSLEEDVPRTPSFS